MRVRQPQARRLSDEAIAGAIDYDLIGLGGLGRIAQHDLRRCLLIPGEQPRVRRRVGVGGGLELRERSLRPFALGREREAASAGGRRGRPDARFLDHHRIGEQLLRARLHPLMPRPVAEHDRADDDHGGDDRAHVALPIGEHFLRLARQLAQIVLLQPLLFGSFHGFNPAS